MSSPTPRAQPEYSVPIGQAFSIGAAHFHAGRLEQAEAIARILIDADPQMADGHHLLGVIAYQRGDNETAVGHMTRAIELNPSVPEYCSNRALVLCRLGRDAEAEAGFRHALAMDPQFTDAMSNYSRFLCDMGRADEGLQWANKAVSLQPGSAPACNQLGISLMGCGRFKEAEAAYRRALAIQPDFNQFLNNLANALHQQGRLDESVAIFGKAIALDPRAVEPHINLANLLRDMDRIDESIAEFHVGLSLRSDLPDALACLGTTYREQGRIDLAVDYCRKAIALQPRSAVLRSNLLYLIQYHPDYDSKALLAEHRAYGELAVGEASARTARHANSADPDRPLRIGMVSADFRTHPVGRQILPLFRLRDRAAFQFICYSNVTRPDKTTDLFRQLADDWRPITGVGDDNAAELVRRDAIDILIDLSMHTAGHRLGIFTRKPAPVSATFAAYPGSTGISRIDWRISDPHLDPPGADADYVERTARLPRTFWCFEPDLDAPDVNPLPALTNGYVTFGCLGHACKVNATVIPLWAAVMKQVDNSRLRLLATPGAGVQHICDQFSAAGIDPGRVDFVVRQPRIDYLREFLKIDIGLDTIPYNGHTTTLDSFWMGVPVVSIVGRTVVGRGGLSQLANLGLSELVAAEPAGFVRISADLASDLPALNAMRQSLRGRMAQSPLCDTRQFCGDIQTLLRQLWREWCSTHAGAQFAPSPCNQGEGRGGGSSAPA